MRQASLIVPQQTSLTGLMRKPVGALRAMDAPAEDQQSRDVEDHQAILPKALGILGILSMVAGFFIVRSAKRLESIPLAERCEWSMQAEFGGINPRYRCKTTKGDFLVELFIDRMPITAGNWIDLAESGFYNGIHFHRVIPNFVVQFGCPFAKDPKSLRCGTGGPPPNTSFLVGDQVMTRDNGGNIPDEFLDRIRNGIGTLSMANTGMPNTGGSQFFINLAVNEFLNWWRYDLGPSKHPVFGVVVDGFEVVKRISNAQRDDRDNPVNPIQMISITRED
eukprot:GGOE01036204.1.p1 GENE.GGOE01036204.1~~GGOE01036204.1.p1  ORF type:complete len:327 (+),score=93.45 GGOE01036204.1:150-983(+)